MIGGGAVLLNFIELVVVDGGERVLLSIYHVLLKSAVEFVDGHRGDCASESFHSSDLILVVHGPDLETLHVCGGVYLLDAVGDVSEADGEEAESLEAAAEVLGQSVQSVERVSLADSRFGNAGMEPAVIGAAVAQGENALSAPVQGRMGVFVIKTGAANNIEAAFDAESEKAQLSARFAYLPYQAIQLIEDNAEVTDNRHNFQ